MKKPQKPLSESTSPGILFVGIECADLPDAVADYLRTRGDSAEYVDDVYRAMARIGRRAPDAVVVAVDWLSTEELQFFEILGRAHPDIAVYALGANRAQPKVNRAAGDGATILATLDDLTELCRLTGDNVASPQTARSQPEPDPGLLRSRGDSENQDTLALTGNVFDAGLDKRLRAGLEGVASPRDEPDAEDRSDDANAAGGGTLGDGSSGNEISRNAPIADGIDRIDGEDGAAPARVPWLPLAETPPRVPPLRVPPGAHVSPDARVPLDRADLSEAAPASKTVWEDEDDPPLLSDEELRALLGDDATFDRDR